ncbi:TonB-dependent receptor domain-containing protein [Roseateles sp. LYH14W]|uniref:TonB-dependent receptor domain-containing protein n=1 Tax=Pelomonas parva TaxID=3299032 RepID=A0ABW7F3P4_9BURK
MTSPFERPGRATMAALICAMAPLVAHAQMQAFDIAAGDLRAGIDQFARETRAQLIYRLQDVQGLRTQGVKGSHEPDRALELLLAGTPLKFRRDGTALVIYRPAPEAAAEAPEINALETVTVTAQRRPEAAQTVPIALTAFNAAALETHRIHSLQDASRLTPGLLVSAFSPSNPTIAIRGANNTFNQMGVSKPVAVVVDDVFIPRNSAASFELFDLDSLTVLKGPQGTLFGRNVTGGAIVINTAKPAYGQRLNRAEISLGNFDSVQVNALTNLPLGEEQALKISAAVKRHGGYGSDRLTGREQDDLDSRNARAQLRLGLSRDVEALVSADYAEDASGGRTLSSTTLGDDGNRRTSELGVPQGYGRTLWGVSAKLEWALPAGELTSVTALRHSRSAEDYSGVGASHTLLTAGSQSVTSDAERVRTVSQELRYASPRWKTGDFQVGAFLLDEDGSRQLGVRGFAARTGVLASSTLADQRVRTRSYSLFADGSWHLLPTLDLVAGVRYTHDRKTADLVRTDALRPASSFTAQGLSAAWSEVTPRVALNWQPSREALLYASVTKGFTAGGFNTDAASLASLTTPFNPETVVNKELGLKSQWFGNRLRINLSVFDMRYRDKQEFVNNTVTGILTITNASEATIKGREIEVALKPLSWLGLSLNHGHLDARYDRFVIGSINYTGNPLASTPRNKTSVAADLRLPLAGLGHFIGAVSYARLTSYNTGAANDPNLQIPGYELVNANVGLESADGRWRVLAWLKNAANRAYILTRSTQVVRAEYLGEPRTVGLTAAMRF